MALPKFWWVDPTDFNYAKSKMDSVRENQTQGWSWIEFYPDEYRNESDGARALASEIGIPSMFGAGKVVRCWGLPKFHASLAEDIPLIPDGILFILVSRPAKNLKLYTRSKKFAERAPGTVVIDDPFSLTKEGVVNFIRKRAEVFGLRIDDMSCRMLADLAGMDPDCLTNEIRKLSYFISDDKTITPFAIEQTVYGDGEANIINLMKFILLRKGEHAHELTHRLLVKSHPLSLLGFLVSWVRGAMVAAGAGCDYGKIKQRAGQVKKLSKSGKKWKVEPMWPNTGKLFFSCKELTENGRSANWVWHLASEIMRLQMAARIYAGNLELLIKEFHGFVDRAMEDELEDGLRAPPLAITSPPKATSAGTGSARRKIESVEN